MWEEARQSYLHRGKAGERKAITDAKGMQSKPRPPLCSEELQPAHFPLGSFLAQETDRGKKHSCLDLMERGCQVEYFLHSDGKEHRHSLPCAAMCALIRESS